MLRQLSINFFLEYLLLPILILLVALGLFIVKQKKDLLAIRPLLLLLLVFGLPMMLAGFFGFIDLAFMPWYYLALQAIFLVLGMFYVRELDRLLGPDRREQPIFVHLLTALILLTGDYIFSLIFNLAGTMHYGLWAATCVLPFYVPVLFVRTFEALIAIPNKIEKVWYYPRHAAEVILDNADHYRLMILAVELYKNAGSSEPPIRVKARTPQDLPFGMWFQKFIDDYNYKFPHEPIQTANEEEVEYGWLFYYLKPSPFKLRRYIDTDLSIEDNNLTEHCLIVAKRVSTL